ncbi:MAG: DUF4298 domain-containing protein [bacterium]|nr:DUF4298 domain-containing protein [bacterium]
MKSSPQKIIEMENRLNKIVDILSRLEADLDEFEKIKSEFDILEKYYKSKDWQNDFEADERGEFPHDLPRGVLSEDEIWNALAIRDEILDKMKQISYKR